jgi:hypothetical protein
VDTRGVPTHEHFQRTAVTGAQALEQRKVVRLTVHGSGVLAPPRRRDISPAALTSTHGGVTWVGQRLSGKGFGPSEFSRPRWTVSGVAGGLDALHAGGLENCDDGHAIDNLARQHTL